jgi:hypothetical protein
LAKDELRITKRPLNNPLSFTTILSVHKKDKDLPKFTMRYESSSIFSVSDSREYTAAKLIKKLRAGEGYVFANPNPIRPEEVQLIVGSYWIQSNSAPVMYGAGGTMVTMGVGGGVVNNPYIQFTYNQIDNSVTTPTIPYESVASRWEAKRSTVRYTDGEKPGDEQLFVIGDGYQVAYLDRKGNQLVIRNEFSSSLFGAY